ncbi:hypothetical protein IQ238_14190 [Pleurocapsales cyanobacterium LEGE 06147]|nr:hypothetical protein [Pleurocapsales cyanobacterium LEGE 06147]
MNSSKPQLRLVLGADALDVIHAKLEAMTTELADWKDLSIDTAFDGVAMSAIGG